MNDPASSSRHVYAFGRYRLDQPEHRLLRDEQTIPLSPKAFDLLVALVSRAGHLVTKEQLLQEVWPGTFVEEANLSYTASLLRKALGDEREPYRYVETVHKRGYRFIGVIDGPRTEERTPERVDVKVPLEWDAPVSAGVTAPALPSSSAHRSFVGRHLLGLIVGASILVVIFNQAIARDAHYARAHAGLADAYIIQGNYAFRAPNEAHADAKRAAMEALRLDDQLAEAHTALAAVSMWHDYDWAAGERGFQRAIAMNRNSAYAHHWYALLLTYQGRRTEAIEHIKRAERLDPLAPQIAIEHSTVLYRARDYDRAVQQARKVLSYAPEFPNGHRVLGFELIAGGRCEEGIARLLRSFQLFGGEAFSDLKLAWGYARCGRAYEARLLLSKALAAKGPGYLEPNAVAHVFVALGDHEHALTWLERAVAERAPYVADMAVEPALDPLRSDPRFVRLLKRLGLPTMLPRS